MPWIARGGPPGASRRAPQGLGFDAAHSQPSNTKGGDEAKTAHRDRRDDRRLGGAGDIDPSGIGTPMDPFGPVLALARLPRPPQLDDHDNLGDDDATTAAGSGYHRIHDYHTDDAADGDGAAGTDPAPAVGRHLVGTATRRWVLLGAGTTTTSRTT
jgi:hypothetical protein